MNILFLSHYFPPEGNAPASRVHSMCRRWVTAGHQVMVVTSAPNVPNGVVYEGYRNVWRQAEEIDGIHVVRCWTLLAANRGIVKRTLNYLSYFAVATWRGLRDSRPDVVIATSPQFFCGWAGAWVARLKRVPFVLEIRDIWPDSIRAVGVLGNPRADAPQGTLLRLLRALERRLYRTANRIVTVGHGYKTKLLERGVGEERIEVIPNGVETVLYSPRAADPALRAEAGAGPADFLVGYVGTVGMAHGLEVVLEAGRMARDRGLSALRFVIIGDGARFHDLLAQLDEDDPGNVRLLGRRPKVQMPAWLASVDACLVHLRDEDLFASVLPSKIFEAFAMARPILLGLRGEAQRLVSQGPSGLCFEPENAAELLDSVVELMNLPDRGAKFGAAGYELALRYYRLDPLAKRYVVLLEEMV